MFAYRHYVPMLKGKEGEFRALEHLQSNARDRLTPFIDIPRRDLDPKTNQPKDSIDIYLEKKAKKIHKAWGTARQIFIDVFDLDLGLRTPSGIHFIEFLFSQLRDCDVLAIPVIGLDRAEDNEYVDAVKETILSDKRGVSIRLLHEDLEMPTATYSDVEDLIRTLGLTKSSVHLLMDFRSVFKDDLSGVADIATGFLANLPDTNYWNTITLSLSGFPENLRGIPPRSIGILPRTELDLRDLLVLRKRNISRFPAFGDYGICHPDLLDYDPRFNPGAAIRYTIERSWLIVKEGSLKKYGFDQFRDLSDTLRRRPEYYGPTYSWGDNYIDECANCTVGKGSLTTWRQVGTNHHITLVGSQIANFPAI